MTIRHIYTGEDHRSHIEEVCTRLHGSDERGRTEELAVTTIHFAEGTSELMKRPRNPTLRQMVIALSGRFEVTTTGGESMVLEPGDIMLADDMTGEGHLTRQLDGYGASLILPFADGTDLADFFDPAPSHSYDAGFDAEGRST